MKSIKKKLWVVITCVVVFALFAALHCVGAFKWVEDKTYDSRMRVTADAIAPSDMITLVLLDQSSLDWARTEMDWGYPWPRSAYGTIIDFFNYLKGFINAIYVFLLSVSFAYYITFF